MSKNGMIITALVGVILMMVGVVVFMGTGKIFYRDKTCVSTTKECFERKFETCTVDMDGKNFVDTYTICGRDKFFTNDYRQVILKNVSINNRKREIIYEFNGLSDEPGNRITTIYHDGYIFDIHIGEYANILNKVEIKDNLLVLTEGSYTDIPAFANKYDVAGLYVEQNMSDIIEIDY